MFAGVYGAMMRSYDRGANWQYAELRTPPPVVTCLAVSPAYEQDGILFAGTLEDGVFRSADRGTRWAAWNFGLIDLGVLCLALSPAFGQDETLVVGTETGVFRSTNGGRAWRELGLPTDLAPVLSVAFSPDYASDGLLLAGTESNGLWMSHDSGRSWELVEALVDGAVNALDSSQAAGGCGRCSSYGRRNLRVAGCRQDLADPAIRGRGRPDMHRRALWPRLRRASANRLLRRAGATGQHLTCAQVETRIQTTSEVSRGLGGLFVCSHRHTTSPRAGRAQRG